MSAHAIIVGTLAAAPVTKTSKAGKDFVTANVKVGRGGEDLVWWRCVAFVDDVKAEFGRLRAGDSVSLQGALTLEVWAPEGKEPRVSPSLIASQVIALSSRTDR